MDAKKISGAIGAVILGALVWGMIKGAATPDVITMEEFASIQNGMSYSQVATIVGEDGELTGDNHIEGVPGVMESVDTKMYTWKNVDGSNMVIMLQNDKLMQKNQFGLD